MLMTLNRKQFGSKIIPMKLIKIFLLATCVLAMWLAVPQARAQGTTAFTYQGQLHDGGTNANGTYTMIFKLYDALTIGNQIGNTITTSPILANGLFTASAVWKYKGIYREADAQVGQWSDVISTTVMG
jgi:hypothetical protein